jgi:hypothetical protein
MSSRTGDNLRATPVTQTAGAQISTENDMTYASTSIDRRAEYYARCASVIAADPLDFYTRAEKGRRFQAAQFNVQADPTAQARVVAKYLKSLGQAPAQPQKTARPEREGTLLQFPLRAQAAFH